MKEYSEIKVENDNFNKKLKQTEKLKELKEKRYGSQKNVDDTAETFRDLINKYKDRGYKIPDLSVRHNLFQPSPLLLENHKISDFYKFMKKGQDVNDKNVHFLLKINKMLNEKGNDASRNVIDQNSEFAKKVERRRTLFKLSTHNNLIDVDDGVNHNHNHNYKKENEELEKYNKTMKNIITTNEFGSAFGNGGKNFILKHLKSSYPEAGSKSRNISSNIFGQKTSSSAIALENQSTKNKTASKNNVNNFNTQTKIKSDMDSNFTLGSPKKNVSPIINLKSNLLSYKKNQKEINFLENSQKVPNSISQILDGSNKTKSRSISKMGESNDKDKDKIPYDNTNSPISKHSPTSPRKKPIEFHSSIRKRNRTQSLTSIDSRTSIYSMDKTAALLNEKSKLLDNEFEKVSSHDYSNLKNFIRHYSKKYKGYDDKEIDELFNKNKLEPTTIMKTIDDLKNRIDLFNIYDIYKSNFFNMGKLDTALPTLNKIK
jgi:hypothetical protein